MKRTLRGLWLSIKLAITRKLTPAQHAELARLLGAKRAVAYAAFCRSMYYEQTRWQDETGLAPRHEKAPPRRSDTH